MSQTSDLQPARWQILELKCLRLQIPSAWYFGSTAWECQDFRRQLPMRVNWSEYDWWLASLLNVVVIRWGVKMKKKTAVKRLVRECAMIARTPDTNPNQLNDGGHHWAVCIADSSWVINCFHEVQLEGDFLNLYIWNQRQVVVWFTFLLIINVSLVLLLFFAPITKFQLKSIANRICFNIQHTN